MELRDAREIAQNQVIYSCKMLAKWSKSSPSQEYALSVELSVEVVAIARAARHARAVVAAVVLAAMARC